MRVGPVFTCLLVVYFLLFCSALPHTKEFNKLTGGTIGAEFVPSATGRENGMGREPSCEELRAMWRFSKRQSRATDLTNEIPTYRDPFAYNMWIPYARSRSIVGGVGQRRKGIIYGKPVFEVPRSRNREEMARLFNTAVPQGSVIPARKAQTAFRLGGGGGAMGQVPQLTPQSGSFQHLQKLIRAERARELQQQRMAEEEAARIAALKEVGAPTYFGRMVQDPLHPNPAEFVYGENGGPMPASPVRKFAADDEYLSPKLNAHMYNLRAMPDAVSRTTDLERGFFRH